MANLEKFQRDLDNAAFKLLLLSAAMQYPLKYQVIRDVFSEHDLFDTLRNLQDEAKKVQREFGHLPVKRGLQISRDGVLSY